MAGKTKRPYSRQFAHHGMGKSYFLSDAPAALWFAARRKARQQGLSMRTVILTLLQAWINEAPAKGDR